MIVYVEITNKSIKKLERRSDFKQDTKSTLKNLYFSLLAMDNCKTKILKVPFIIVLRKEKKNLPTKSDKICAGSVCYKLQTLTKEIQDQNK